ncbi:molybdate ABC transporter substrate-binding protein [Cellulomonas marina]|uniref:molybdate ABC transporter substrate-binding protein n=1 Tax=Cellulomonas marina TaxID=988821 RepID=UPI001EF37E59|nr:molybdate ABC transporter substrate-binding protein [Cellulomonas marina]
MAAPVLAVRAAAAVAVAGLAACAGAGDAAAPAGDPVAAPASPELAGTVTVLAAASLTDAMAELETAFESRHPSVDVVVSLAGSSALAAQVLAGAPADVLVTASTATMQPVVDAELVEDLPVVLASNTLEIAVPPDDPGAVTGLADLADPGRTVALCAPEVPCGAASAELFALVGLVPAPDTLENDVRAALTKVRLGEVDAALVYRTDVIAAGDEVRGVPVPEAAQVVTEYPAAVLADAPSPAAARAFLDLLTSADGQDVLRDGGFLVADAATS